MRNRSNPHLVTFFVAAGLLACLAHVALYVGMHKIRTGPFGAFNRVDRGEVNTDIVVLGSSRAALHYDPDAIRHLTGLSAFNLGRIGSRSEVYAGILGHYLHHNRPPRLILLNADYNSCDSNTELYDPVQFTPYLKDQALFDALRARHPRVWAMRYLPLYGYISDDVEFRHDLGLKALVGRWPRENYRDGFEAIDIKFDDDRLGPDANRTEFLYTIGAEGCTEFAQSLVVARSLGIPAIVVFSPIYSGVNRRIRDRQVLLAQFEKAADANGAEFWDYSALPSVSDSQFYFADSFHMNMHGAAMFSQILGQRLAEWLPRQGIRAAGQ
jgi:hypothetical protein